jgi:hypothetical protein
MGEQCASEVGIGGMGARLCRIYQSCFAAWSAASARNALPQAHMLQIVCSREDMRIHSSSSAKSPSSMSFGILGSSSSPYCIALSRWLRIVLTESGFDVSSGRKETRL